MEFNETDNNSVSGKLEEIFGKEYSGTLPEKLEDVKDRMTSMEVVVSDNIQDIKTIEDKEYIIKTIKDMVKLGQDVLEILKNDLRLGSPGHVGENFSMVYKSVTESIQRLAELNLKLFDINVSQNPPPQTNNQTNIFVGNGREAIEMLGKIGKKQRDSSDLNKIDLSEDGKLSDSLTITKNL